eukprot:GILJ01010331.1.p1 GENE.GILJ01010331.1~~GILJ01010331.1.p1  ORF type:complete len:250 (-),score=12.46 GILJ01010331.1:116-865(-)
MEDVLRWFLLLMNALVLAFTVRQRHFHSSEHNRMFTEEGKKTILLVIAHPDDETMFFFPFLRHNSSHEIRILCLSTGNADKLGNMRKLEMENCCRRLQIPPQRLFIEDHPALQDGMQQRWSIDVISELVWSRMSGVDMVVTFDQHGVSAHPNHIATHLGVRQMLVRHADELSNVDALMLESTSFFRKYAGIFDVASLFSSVFFSNANVVELYRTLRCHHSQFVWFRKLFILISRFAYYNTFRHIPFKRS